MANKRTELPEVVNAATLGDLLLLTEQSITELARRGVLRRIGHGRFAFRESLRGWSAMVKEITSRRGGEEVTQRAAEERARLAAAQAEAQEIKNARHRRELVSAADVVTEWASILTKVRGRVLSVPARLALTPGDRAALDKELREALTELADDA